MLYFTRSLAPLFIPLSSLKTQEGTMTYSAASQLSCWLLCKCIFVIRSGSSTLLIIVSWWSFTLSRRYDFPTTSYGDCNFILLSAWRGGRQCRESSTIMRDLAVMVVHLLKHNINGDYARIPMPSFCFFLFLFVKVAGGGFPFAFCYLEKLCRFCQTEIS